MKVVKDIIGVLLISATLSLTLRDTVLADATNPTEAEVENVLALLQFRDALIDAPLEAADDFKVWSTREALASINFALETAGSGADGWVFLLSTSVFAMVGVGEARTLVMFYNPWVDASLITEWDRSRGALELVDIEWLPGDLLRDPGGTIDPRPPWLRTGDARTSALITALIETVGKFETLFTDVRDRANWRTRLGLADTTIVQKHLSPVLALRIYESQLRLKALAVRAEGEDPLLLPLRAATIQFIQIATREGFGPLLDNSPETTRDMVALLSAINPLTMQGLAPVSFVADADEVLVYFTSPMTADFAISARYQLSALDVTLRQIDFIPYAAVYAQNRYAQQNQAAATEPAPPPEMPVENEKFDNKK